ncbi:hypothetical protein N7507_006081 [Penicillium longicatenatum]|nr:hypothetical protein N7507_006081 [Penicillium longicatenatum]
MCWEFARGHKCPDGFNLDGDKCEHNTRPECREGYSLDKGLRVRDGKPICSKNIHYDIARGECVSNQEVHCPAGSELRGHDCVLGENPFCKFGFTFDGERCVSDNTSPSCGNNEYLEDGNCVVLERPSCPPQTTFSSTGCVPFQFVPKCKHRSFPDDRGQCVVEKTTTCPRGTACKKSGCMARVPICVEGAEYNDQIERCVSIKGPSCPLGHSRKNGVCQPDLEMQCEKGFTRDGNQCCKKPECSNNFYYDHELKKCVGTTTLPHPDDYPEDGVCVRGPTTCPEGYHIRNWRCVSTSVQCERGARYNKKTGFREADADVIECPDGTEFKDGCCSRRSSGDYCASATWCGPKTSPIGSGGSMSYTVWELSTTHRSLAQDADLHYQEIDGRHEFERHHLMEDHFETAEVEEKVMDEEEITEEWGEWEEDEEDEFGVLEEEFDAEKV